MPHLILFSTAKIQYTAMLCKEKECRNVWQGLETFWFGIKIKNPSLDSKRRKQFLPFFYFKEWSKVREKRLLWKNYVLQDNERFFLADFYSFLTHRNFASLLLFEFFPSFLCAYLVTFGVYFLIYSFQQRSAL